MKRIRCFTMGVVVLVSLLASAAAGDVFTISTSYRNLLSNTEGTGILDRILVEAFSRIGITAEIVYTPTERSLYDVNAGVLDGEINRIAGMEKRYPNLRRVPEPNMTMEFVAFAKTPLEIDGWESLRQLDIGLVRGWKILEEHTEGFPYVTKVPTEVGLFTMLDKGRLDAALYSRLTGLRALEELGMEGVRCLEPPLASRKMYLYVYKDHQALTDEIAEALRALKADGTYDRIVEDVLHTYGIKPR